MVAMQYVCRVCNRTLIEYIDKFTSRADNTAICDRCQIIKNNKKARKQESE